MSSRRLLLSHNKNKTQRKIHSTRHRLLSNYPRLQSSSTAKDLNPAKLAIKHYLQHIYKYLDVKYCFVSGAFVIEDADGELLALMAGAPKHKVIARTHDVYLDRKTTIMYETHFPDKYEFIVTCKCDAEEIKVKTVKRVTEKKINEKIKLEHARELLEELLAAEKKAEKAETLRHSEADYVLEEEGEGEAELLDEAEYKEEDKFSNDFIRNNYDEFVAAFAAALEQHDTVSRPVRNIKWYPFTDKIDKKRYMYIKLEDSETISIAHLMDMYRRYGPGKALQCVKSRREDCFKEKATGEICRFNVATEKRREKETAFDSPKTITLPDEPRAIAIRETYNRMGDEMFIPQELNTFLLRNKEAKVKFTYDDGSEHVTVTTQVGGRRSKKSKKSKRKTIRSKKKRGTRRRNH